jgi:exodeoxyribonuclease VII large subunit
LLRLRLTAERGTPGDAIARLATLLAHRRHATAMRLAALNARLHALDPHAVLKRGYAMALSGKGTIVTDAARLRVGDSLTLHFSRGAADVQVRAVQPDAGEDGGER